MKYHIIVSDDVHAELEFLTEWIEAQRKGYGRIFVKEYESALKLIEQFPFSHQCKSKYYRIIPIARFNYVLVYRICPKSIIVVRLIYARSDFDEIMMKNHGY